MLALGLGIILGQLALGFARGDSAPSATEPELRQAIEAGLRRIEQGANSYPQHRQCFSCHHQAMSMWSTTEAARRGIDIDLPLRGRQIEFTLASFRPKKDEMLSGRGIGGASDTVGWALFALHRSGHPADETTTSMVRFLLARQRPDGSWTTSANRPPTEASPFTTTTQALRAMRTYGQDLRGLDEVAAEWNEKVKVSIEKASAWLRRSQPETTEDHVFRLLGLLEIENADALVREARDALVSRQRVDGGWAQTSELQSDAYATATVLVALRAAGMSANDPAYQRGVHFLLMTQREDGAWLVETRSRPIQTFFDNGDPGEKSQFISFSATNWAVLALVEALPVAKEP